MMADRAEDNTHSWKPQLLKTTPLNLGQELGATQIWLAWQSLTTGVDAEVTVLLDTPNLSNKRASHQTVHLGGQGQIDAGILIYARLGEKKDKTKRELSESGLDDNKVL